MDINKELFNVKSINDFKILRKKIKTPNFKLKLSKCLLDQTEHLIKLDFKDALIKHSVPKWSLLFVSNVLTCVNDENEWKAFEKDFACVLKCLYKNCQLFMENSLDKWTRMIKFTLVLIYKSSCKNQAIAKDVFLALGEPLLNLLSEGKLSYNDLLYCSQYINMCLSLLEPESLHHIGSSVQDCLSKVADVLLSCGDYTLQSNLLEILLLLTFGLHNSIWLPRSDLAGARTLLQNLTFSDFDKDCRKFLNLLNEKDQRVVSLECVRVLIGHEEIYNEKSQSPCLNQFWVDLNRGSHLITMGCERHVFCPASTVPQPDSWETISVPFSAVTKLRVTNVPHHRWLDMELSCAFAASSKELQEALYQARRSLSICTRDNSQLDLELLTTLLPQASYKGSSKTDEIQSHRAMISVQEISLRRSIISTAEMLSVSRPENRAEKLANSNQRATAPSKAVSQIPKSKSNSSGFIPRMNKIVEKSSNNASKNVQVGDHIAKHFSEQAAQLLAPQNIALHSVCIANNQTAKDKENLTPPLSVIDRNLGLNKEEDLSMEMLLHQALYSKTNNSEVIPEDTCKGNQTSAVSIRIIQHHDPMNGVLNENVPGSLEDDVIPDTPVKKNSISNVMKVTTSSLVKFYRGKNSKKCLTKKNESVTPIIEAAVPKTSQKFTENEPNKCIVFDQSTIDEFFDSHYRELPLTQPKELVDPKVIQEANKSDSDDFSMDQDLLASSDVLSESSFLEQAIPEAEVSVLKITQHNDADNFSPNKIGEITFHDPQEINIDSNKEGSQSPKVGTNPNEILKVKKQKIDSAAAKPHNVSDAPVSESTNEKKIIVNTPAKDSTKNVRLDTSKRRKLYSPKDDVDEINKTSNMDAVSENQPNSSPIKGSQFPKVDLLTSSLITKDLKIILISPKVITKPNEILKVKKQKTDNAAAKFHSVSDAPVCESTNEKKIIVNTPAKESTKNVRLDTSKRRKLYSPKDDVDEINETSNMDVVSENQPNSSPIKGSQSPKVNLLTSSLITKDLKVILISPKVITKSNEILKVKKQKTDNAAAKSHSVSDAPVGESTNEKKIIVNTPAKEFTKNVRLNTSKRRKLYSPKDDVDEINKTSNKEAVSENQPNSSPIDKLVLNTTAVSYSDIEKDRKKNTKGAKPTKASSRSFKTDADFKPRTISVPKNKNKNIYASNSYRDNPTKTLSAAEKRLSDAFDLLKYGGKNLEYDETPVPLVTNNLPDNVYSYLDDSAHKKNTSTQKQKRGLKVGVSDSSKRIKKKKSMSKKNCKKSFTPCEEKISKSLKVQTTLNQSQPILHMSLRSRKKIPTNEPSFLLDEIPRNQKESQLESSFAEDVIIKSSRENKYPDTRQTFEMIPPKPNRTKTRSKLKLKNKFKIVTENNDVDTSLPPLLIEKTPALKINESFNSKMLDNIYMRSCLFDNTSVTLNESLTVPQPADTHVPDQSEHRVQELQVDAAPLDDQEFNNEIQSIERMSDNVIVKNVSMEINSPHKEIESAPIVSDYFHSEDILPACQNAVIDMNLLHTSPSKCSETHIDSREGQRSPIIAFRATSNIYKAMSSKRQSASKSRNQNKHNEKPKLFLDNIAQKKIYRNNELMQMWFANDFGSVTGDDALAGEEPTSICNITQHRDKETALTPIYEEDKLDSSELKDESDPKPPMTVSTPKKQKSFDINKYQIHLSPLSSVESTASIKNLMYKYVKKDTLQKPAQVKTIRTKLSPKKPIKNMNLIREEFQMHSATHKSSTMAASLNSSVSSQIPRPRNDLPSWLKSLPAFSSQNHPHSQPPVSSDTESECIDNVPQNKIDKLIMDACKNIIQRTLKKHLKKVSHCKIMLKELRVARDSLTVAATSITNLLQELNRHENDSVDMNIESILREPETRADMREIKVNLIRLSKTDTGSHGKQHQTANRKK